MLSFLVFAGALAEAPKHAARLRYEIKGPLPSYLARTKGGNASVFMCPVRDYLLIALPDLS